MARYKIAQKGFTNNHLLNINAVLETKDDNANILIDTIFVEFIEGIKKNNVHVGYNTNEKISMKFSSYELRVLTMALKELISTGSSKYKKYSNPALANSNGNVKELSFGFSNEKYFLNIEEVGRKKFAIAFSGLELRALIEAITIICNECDENLYKYQRAIDKQIRTQKANEPTSPKANQNNNAQSNNAQNNYNQNNSHQGNNQRNQQGNNQQNQHNSYQENHYNGDGYDY